MQIDRIWAPWRLEYVQGDKKTPLSDEAKRGLLPGADPDCFLCQCVADPDDRERMVIEHREHSLTVLNRYPYNNGHLLISPREHLAGLEDLTTEVQFELTETIGRMVELLKRVLHPQGFNIGLNLGLAAGAGLPGHLHWHVVPRWNGDTNFMPALAGINVIPQSLDALWEALIQELQKG
ncbi:MAG TPA: HIT domain-containing protein [Thermoguttaceae bacterium]|nr:HIT domain-containing protein [Thermoguttaceae bacterium]